MRHVLRNQGNASVLWAAFVGILALLLGGCGSDAVTSAAEDSQPAVRVSEGDQPAVTYIDGLLEFYQETATDVVSYADQVSLVTAVSSEPSKKDLEAEDNGGMVTTNVTLRIDKNIWVRPGAAVLDGSFIANRGASLTRTVNDASPTTTRVAALGGPVFEVGGQYLMPLAVNRGEWVPLLPTAEFEVVDGRVVLGETQKSELARQLEGLTVAEASEVYATAKPDPLAVKYADLEPTQRSRAMAAERRG